MNRLPAVTLVLLLAVALAHARAQPAAPAPGREFGVIVMAHGGGRDWNAQVLAAVAPLQEQVPVEVAFGMAEPASLQEAAGRLEAQGVRRIAVVRLFISGESWRERTEQILGLRPGAPPRNTVGQGASDESGHHGAIWRIVSEARFAVSESGLAEADGMGRVLADRARALSRDPGREQVLILAHGPADDAENARWIAWMEARAETVRQALPFRRVQVMTLREDWPEKRAAVVERIRGTVAAATAAGVTTVVIPFRVQGFGPYREVLDGLSYVADGQGLLPHPEVTRWIAEQAAALDREGRAAEP